MINQYILSGEIFKSDAIRTTPGGMEILTFEMRHRSLQSEAGEDRRVDFNIKCVAVGKTALEIERLSDGLLLRCEGFLISKSKDSRLLVFNVKLFKVI